jgi:hypothetical protein
LIVSNAVDVSDIFKDILSEVTGVNWLFIAKAMVSHIEDIVHLVVNGVSEFGEELGEQVEGMHVPRVILDVVHAALLIVEVQIPLQLIQPVDGEELLPNLLSSLHIRFFLSVFRRGLPFDNVFSIPPI